MKLWKLILAAVILIVALILSPVIIIVGAIWYKVSYRTHEGFGIRYRISKASKKMIVASNHHDEKTAIKWLASTGGAWAMRLDAATVSLLRATAPSMTQKIMLAFVKPGYTINLVSDVVRTLTKGELRAIVLHEIGHIVNGDLDKDGMVVGIEYELAADKFAALHSNPRDMHSALTKVFQFTESEFSKNIHLFTEEEIIPEEERNAQLRLRLEALEAMM